MPTQDADDRVIPTSTPLIATPNPSPSSSNTMPPTTAIKSCPEDNKPDSTPVISTLSLQEPINFLTSAPYHYTRTRYPLMTPTQEREYQRIEREGWEGEPPPPPPGAIGPPFYLAPMRMQVPTFDNEEADVGARWGDNAQEGRLRLQSHGRRGQRRPGLPRLFGSSLQPPVSVRDSMLRTAEYLEELENGLREILDTLDPPQPVSGDGVNHAGGNEWYGPVAHGMSMVDMISPTNSPRERVPLEAISEEPVAGNVNDPGVEIYEPDLGSGTGNNGASGADHFSQPSVENHSAGRDFPDIGSYISSVDAPDSDTSSTVYDDEDDHGFVPENSYWAGLSSPARFPGEWYSRTMDDENEELGWHGRRDEDHDVGRSEEEGVEPEDNDRVSHGDWRPAPPVTRDGVPSAWEPYQKYLVWACRGAVDEITDFMQTTFAFEPPISRTFVGQQLNGPAAAEHLVFLERHLPGEIGTMQRARARVEMNTNGRFSADIHEGCQSGIQAEPEATHPTYQKHPMPEGGHSVWNRSDDVQLNSFIGNAPEAILSTYRDVAGSDPGEEVVEWVAVRSAQTIHLGLSMGEIAGALAERERRWEEAYENGDALFEENEW